MKLHFLFAGAIFAALFAVFLGHDILTFTSAYVAAGVLPFLFSRRCAPADVFRPFIGIAVLLYLYSLSTILFIFQFKETFNGERVESDDLIIFQLACLLGIAGLSVGACLAQNMGSFRLRVGSRQQQLLVVTASALGLLALPFIADKFMPWVATSYYDVATSSRVDKLSDQAAGVKEVILEIFPITLILCAAVATIFNRNQRAISRVGAAIVFSLYLVTTVLSGWRGQMMNALLILCIYFHYRVRPFRTRDVVAGSIVIYIWINMLSFMRASPEANLIEMFSILTGVFEDKGIEIFALQGSTELQTSSNLVRLIQGLRLGETDFGWGSIAVKQFAVLMPRPLFPDRPDASSEMFVKLFYPGVFESGGGYGYFMLQDGYWDFGLVGVFVYCLVYSLVIERLYQILRAQFASDLYIFLYALLYYAAVLSVVRSGIFNSLKPSIILLAPILLVLMLSMLLRRRSPKRVMINSP